MNAASFLTNPDAHPIALVLLLTERYGKAWMGWEPEALWTTLAKDLAAPSSHTRAKLQAGRTVVTGNGFFERWEIFAPCCQAFNNNLPDFETCRPASLPQLYHAVWTAGQLRGKVPYSDEVERWIAACALNDGIVYLPEPLSFAQPHTLMTEYRCKRCGNVDPDERTPQCDWCGAPASELERKPKYLDPSVIATMWELVRDKPAESVSLDETIVGVHLARLLVARDYLDMRQKQAEQQVKELGLWK
ncbi:MAG: hypothetical protein GYA36_19745 [Veillonellaceae bacterium]|nr:hypothetical protein [Veillonellaceae bacterium]